MCIYLFLSKSNAKLSYHRRTCLVRITLNVTLLVKFLYAAVFIIQRFTCQFILCVNVQTIIRHYVQIQHCIEFHINIKCAIMWEIIDNEVFGVFLNYLCRKLTVKCMDMYAVRSCELRNTLHFAVDPIKIY